MRGRFIEKSEEDKKAFVERMKDMLTWKECEGCKKRKEWIQNKLKGIIHGTNN